VCEGILTLFNKCVGLGTMVNKFNATTNEELLAYMNQISGYGTYNDPITDSSWWYSKYLDNELSEMNKILDKLVPGKKWVSKSL